jgi:hypothetical protein
MPYSSLGECSFLDLKCGFRGSSQLAQRRDGAGALEVPPNTVLFDRVVRILQAASAGARVYSGELAGRCASSVARR